MQSLTKNKLRAFVMRYLLKVRSEAVLSQVVKLVNGAVPIVSVGGIMTPEDAKRRLDMGATLIQIYTGLIYHGPGLVNAIVRSL